MPGVLCEHCTAPCCRYIALPIDTPRTRRDLDDIRWYLMHEGVSVFVEDGAWYVCLLTTCRHLQPDNRCGIYAARPRICREYSTDDCDYHSGDYGWDAHFTCAEHLDEFTPGYLAARRRRAAGRNGRGAHSPAGRRRPRLKAALHRCSRSGASDYAVATTDLRGVPLPVLGGRVGAVSDRDGGRSDRDAGLCGHSLRGAAGACAAGGVR